MRAPPKVDPESLSPPPGLSDRSAKLWSAIVPSRCRSQGRLALFVEALRALDSADRCAATVAIEGLTLTTEKTGAVHAHPAVKLELEFRRQFGSLWNQLRLSFDGSIDGGGGIYDGLLGP